MREITPILVWGAGAIGGTVGAALLRAGVDVLFVDQAADHVAAINQRGLRITGPITEYTVPARAVTPDAVEGVFERIFLCVKAHHTAGAIEAVAPHLTRCGYVASLQNGLNERVIAAKIEKVRTIGCFVNFGADYLEPGVILYGGRGAVVAGELDGERTPRIEQLHSLLRRFEPQAVLTDNIWGYLWGKLIYGALLFATAVTPDSIADVLAAPRHRPVLTRLGLEVGAVAAAAGIRPEAFDGFDPSAFRPGAPAEATTKSFDDMVAHNRKSAKSHSGIWRDLAVRRRPTEVDAQLGPIVEIGAQHGVPTPITARLIALVHDIEAGRREMALALLDELEAVSA
ncbi:2-dehydropantoate 2-reductase [Mycobacterium sp. KBS0706]|uniref:ketopantoate reductase family protein n=1 Tax=Mycobacterium sp. KBS0706 TaxID=2578109 RepID=UPI00110FF052|nr:2-dehydropantoate 2-reductase [Mycobacterium sp. KBS0706]TSD89708.1 2-dehydropantoate 2-reductase [Mycobacterium sp. KBS0706]